MRPVRRSGQPHRQRHPAAGAGIRILLPGGGIQHRPAVVSVEKGLGHPVLRPDDTGRGASFDGLLPGAVSDPQSSYTLCLGITDGVGQSASVTCTVLTEKIYWHRGSDFLALGMYTQHGGLECGWPARFYGDVFIGDVPLRAYIQNLITGG